MSEGKCPLRVALWCAVSSKPQAGPDKVSLEAQEQAGREFARAVGGEVVAVYRIPGHTRDVIFWADAEQEMDAYRELRLDCESRAFEVLHCTDPDRLGRDPALSNQVVSLVEKSGAEVYFASAPHPIGQKSTGHRYIFAIQSTRAGEDQRRRVQHLRMGMRRRRARGLHPNNWPHGYRPIFEGGSAVGAEFDEEQIGAVRLITTRFLEGAPYAHIARELEDAAYRPPRSARNKWDRTTIKNILANPTYAGYVKWSGVASDVKSDKFPAAWDAATYAAVRRELEYRRNNRGRRTVSMFNHVAYCARCGGLMYRTTCGLSTGPVPALQCSTHKLAGTCHANTTHEQTIQDAIIAFLQGIVDETDLEHALASTTGREEELRAQLADLARRAEQVDRKRERLALALAGGAMDVDIYRRADDTLLEDLDALASERTRAQAALDAIPDRASRYQVLEELRDAVSAVFEMPAEQVNAMLRHAGVRVECEGRQVVAVRVV